MNLSLFCRAFICRAEDRVSYVQRWRVENGVENAEARLHSARTGSEGSQRDCCTGNLFWISGSRLLAKGYSIALLSLRLVSSSVCVLRYSEALCPLPSPASPLIDAAVDCYSAAPSRYWSSEGCCGPASRSSHNDLKAHPPAYTLKHATMHVSRPKLSGFFWENFRDNTLYKKPKNQ